MLRFMRLALLLALAVFLTACTVQINTVFEADGSGELRTEFGFTEADAELLSSMDTSAEAFCQDMQSEMLDSEEAGTVTTEHRGGETWCIIAAPFADTDELLSLYEEMAVSRCGIVARGQRLQPSPRLRSPR